MSNQQLDMLSGFLFGFGMGIAFMYTFYLL